MSERIVTNHSCWVGTARESEASPPLAGSIKADVAVVGGGIVGMTAAFLLQRAGRSVVLLEAARIGRQVTGGSTAKVTSLHGLIYGYLMRDVGKDAAEAYARSNQSALRWIEQQIREFGLDCDFESLPAYTYALGPDAATSIERETQAALSLGLPAQLMHDEIGLPYRVHSAVKFDAQGQFHPVNYLTALAAEYQAAGGRLYESSRVLDVDSGRPCKVATAHGSVRADDVIVATNIPILDRGGYFGRAFPYRHMAIAAPIPRERAPAGMYIGVDEPTRSVRTGPWSESERLLVIIGEAFPTGHADTGERLRQLLRFAEEHFGVADAPFRWGNQDYYSADRLPFVGPVLPGLTHLKIATGFNAWGITAGTAAAMALADSVLGLENDWAWIYDSRRTGLRRGGRKILDKNLGIGKSWLAERLQQVPERAPASIRPGEAAITRFGNKTAAAYRDPEGVLHLLDAHCTHLGCMLRWNETETSWDCHCHGSRFDSSGRILNGPTVHDLKRLDSPG